MVLVVDSSGSIRDNNPSDNSFDNWVILKGQSAQRSLSAEDPFRVRVDGNAISPKQGGLSVTLHRL